MTIYHAIERFGEVPVTVARMLKRPLRIHVVGAEKEMNFLDLFKEVSFLLPEDIEVREWAAIHGRQLVALFPCDHGASFLPACLPSRLSTWFF